MESQPDDTFDTPIGAAVSGAFQALARLAPTSTEAEPGSKVRSAAMSDAAHAVQNGAAAKGRISALVTQLTSGNFVKID